MPGILLLAGHTVSCKRRGVTPPCQHTSLPLDFTAWTIKDGWPGRKQAQSPEQQFALYLQGHQLRPKVSKKDLGAS